MCRDIVITERHQLGVDVVALDLANDCRVRVDERQQVGRVLIVQMGARERKV